MQTKNILLVGVGGQGTILISKILSRGILQLGHDVKMSEIHGMSQRGGSVTTQIRYGSKVFAPNVDQNEADTLISFEKLETLRALSFLKRGGTLISDTREIYPASVLAGGAAYPHDALDAAKRDFPDMVVLNAAEIAEQLGNIRVQNIVLLGAYTKMADFSGVDWRKLVAENVPKKAVDLNLKAYDAGYGMC